MADREEEPRPRDSEDDVLPQPPDRPAAAAPSTPSEAAAPAGAEVASAQPDDLAALRRELAERSEQFLRLAADFENFRRRKNQEISDRARYASEEAARALLPVLDNLRRAVEHAAPAEGAEDGPAAPPPGDPQLHDGLRMVVAQFEQALHQIGVEPVATVGARFDPSIHEAIGGEDSDLVSEDTVVAEVQTGYRLYDRLLRPALVRVAHPRRGAGAAR
jgi:molecular chaperone GrpE